MIHLQKPYNYRVLYGATKPTQFATEHNSYEKPLTGYKRLSHTTVCKISETLSQMAECIRGEIACARTDVFERLMELPTIW